MKQVSPQEKFDVSYPMRWNNIMPGVYPVSRMIRSRHIQEGETTKIYGLCWDYAAIFKAIADHYGLQTRITAYKMYMADDYHETGDLETTPNYGMGPAESNALMNRLSEINLSIPEYALNDAMVETYVHYRPEVFMGGAWESYDATSPSGAYADHPNYSLVNWYDGLNTLVAYR
jgi:hypothetical protein